VNFDILTFVSCTRIPASSSHIQDVFRTVVYSGGPSFVEVFQFEVDAMFDCSLFGGVASFVVAADLNINVFWL
jgi:hypothetical protein